MREERAKISPNRDAHDIREGSSRPKYKYSIMAMTIGQDALKQMMVSTGTYCSIYKELSTVYCCCLQ